MQGRPGVCTFKVKVLVVQACLALCDPMDWGPPGSSVHELLRTRILNEYPLRSLADLPDQGIQCRSPTLTNPDAAVQSPERMQCLC